MPQLKPERMAFVSSIRGGYKIVGYFYPSSAPEIKGVVQICHGMAEYTARFEKLISALNDAGYHVCGMDMPGHGSTYELNKEGRNPKGYFGGLRNGWQVLLTDEMGFHEYAVKRFGKEGLKYLLYGHSMGSFVVRSIFSTPRYNRQFDGYVFSSTMGHRKDIGFGNFLTGVICSLGGKKRRNDLLTLISFGDYNKRIKDPKTSLDWLSHDDEEVRKYAEDPMCGFRFTGDGFRTLFGLISFMQSKEAYANIPDKPCFLTYGDEDPVGSYGTGVEGVIEKLKAAGADVRSKKYSPCRHEIINESMKEEYINDLITFFDEVTTSVSA